MTPPETIIAETGAFLLAGALLAVAREAVKKHWIKFSVSFGVNTPDARLLKPPKDKKQPASDAVPIEPVASIDGRRPA